MAVLVFKKFEREFRTQRIPSSGAVIPRYMARYHIFIKHKHKIIEFLGIMTLLPSYDMVFELNYRKCFYWIGRLRFDYTALEHML